MLPFSLISLSLQTQLGALLFPLGYCKQRRSIIRTSEQQRARRGSSSNFAFTPTHTSLWPTRYTHRSYLRLLSHVCFSTLIPFPTSIFPLQFSVSSLYIAAQLFSFRFGFNFPFSNISIILFRVLFPSFLFSLC